MADGSRTSTLTRFNYEDNHIEAIESFKLGPTPSSLADWEAFSTLMQKADIEWNTFKADPKTQSFFRAYMTTVDDAIADPTTQVSL
ncbi:MAG: hypothetical protein H6765_03940 [Candidatus Peribacteria bacterium]|nr:MAG: hypothetical protein H6765_03940 [Candidatus Peribacteria bacterium]